MRLLACWAIVAVACGDGSSDKQAPDAAPPDPTNVMTMDGPVHGAVLREHVQFLGIPYAAPPVGDLRWKAPQRPAPWTAPLAATAYGKRCAQLASATLMNAASTDEDCLYLNVWAPADVTADSKLPVMIWLHGGGNVNGSASEPVPFINTGYFYTGEHLAENQRVVVVSLNYRLGVFGFFAHPALAAEGVSGNQGLLDQQLAFKWVHDNITGFGGDPGNVTIFGESAGAVDVCLHVAAPSSNGLFHRAISESSGCTTRMPVRAEAEARGETFATALQCTGAGALACLRAVPAATIMASTAVAAAEAGGPDVDGTFMPDQPRRLYDTGQIAKVPYLLGSNTDEGTLFVGDNHPTTQAQYMTLLMAVFGPAANGVANQYPISLFPSGLPTPAEAAFARAIGDGRLACPTFDTAERALAAGAKVWLYNYDVPPPIDVPGRYLGVPHGAELISVFGTSPLFTDETKAVSDLMQRYWANFARTGTPNSAADLMWPALQADANVRVNFGLMPTIVQNFRATECAFWRDLYSAQF